MAEQYVRADIKTAAQLRVMQANNINGIANPIRGLISGTLILDEHLLLLSLAQERVNFPCTNAAFELPLRVSSMQGHVVIFIRSFLLRYTRCPCPLPHEPAGFVVIGRLAQGLSLLCGFCSSSRTFALRLPSDPSSRRRPCLRLVLLLVSITMNTIGSRTGDLHPISSRPCRAYHEAPLDRE